MTRRNAQRLPRRPSTIAATEAASESPSPARATGEERPIPAARAPAAPMRAQPSDRSSRRAGRAGAASRAPRSRRRRQGQAARWRCVRRGRAARRRAPPTRRAGRAPAGRASRARAAGRSSAGTAAPRTTVCLSPGVVHPAARERDGVDETNGMPSDSETRIDRPAATNATFRAVVALTSPRAIGLSRRSATRSRSASSQSFESPIASWLRPSVAPSTTRRHGSRPTATPSSTTMRVTPAAGNRVGRAQQGAENAHRPSVRPGDSIPSWLVDALQRGRSLSARC